jgi:hypothetical protein
MKIAIDFDGVICNRKGIPTMEGLGAPKKGAKDAINLLINNGHKVWILTSNPDLNKVTSWLHQYEFPELRITNIKEPAHVYIDDRAIRFTNWQDIRKYFG